MPGLWELRRVLAGRAPTNRVGLGIKRQLNKDKENRKRGQQIIDNDQQTNQRRNNTNQRKINMHYSELYQS